MIMKVKALLFDNTLFNNAKDFQSTSFALLKKVRGRIITELNTMIFQVLV
jgi:hypothetical protein